MGLINSPYLLKKNGCKIKGNPGFVVSTFLSLSLSLYLSSFSFQGIRIIRIIYISDISYFFRKIIPSFFLGGGGTIFITCVSSRNLKNGCLGRKRRRGGGRRNEDCAIYRDEKTGGHHCAVQIGEKKKGKCQVRGVPRDTRRRNFSNKTLARATSVARITSQRVVGVRSKFNIYIVMARAHSPTRYSIRVCHRQISRGLKFPPSRLFALFTQYPRLDSGATRRVAPIVCRDLRFTEPNACHSLHSLLRPPHQINTFTASLFTGAHTYTVYNRLRNDPVAQPPCFMIMCKMHVKASVILDKNRHKHRRS